MEKQSEDKENLLKEYYELDNLDIEFPHLETGIGLSLKELFDRKDEQDNEFYKKTKINDLNKGIVLHKLFQLYPDDSEVQELVHEYDCYYPEKSIHDGRIKAFERLSILWDEKLNSGQYMDKLEKRKKLYVKIFYEKCRSDAPLVENINSNVRTDLEEKLDKTKKSFRERRMFGDDYDDFFTKKNMIIGNMYDYRGLEKALSSLSARHMKRKEYNRLASHFKLPGLGKDSISYTKNNMYFLEKIIPYKYISDKKKEIFMKSIPYLIKPFAYYIVCRNMV